MKFCSSRFNGSYFAMRVQLILISNADYYALVLVQYGGCAKVHRVQLIIVV